MSALTCQFCGRISTKTTGWRQIFTRDFNTHDDEQMYCICPKCHKLVIENNINAIIDPELELDAIRDSMDDDNPLRIAIGMPLKDFLCSNAYLQTQNVFFRDKYDINIQEFTTCMDSTIIKVEPPDDKNRTFVTLDIDYLASKGDI